VTGIEPGAADPAARSGLGAAELAAGRWETGRRLMTTVEKKTTRQGRESTTVRNKKKKTPNELYLEDCTSCACVNPNLGSDTMLGICNLHYQGAKGHIYSTCTWHKYAGNPLIDGENTIYSIHLTCC
jgi:hypothetical protein